MICRSNYNKWIDILVRGFACDRPAAFCVTRICARMTLKCELLCITVSFLSGEENWPVKYEINRCHFAYL